MVFTSPNFFIFFKKKKLITCPLSRWGGGGAPSPQIHSQILKYFWMCNVGLPYFSKGLCSYCSRLQIFWNGNLAAHIKARITYVPILINFNHHQFCKFVVLTVVTVMTEQWRHRHGFGYGYVYIYTHTNSMWLLWEPAGFFIRESISCCGSRVLSLASHVTGLTGIPSHFMCSLCWTEWRLGRSFCEYFGFPMSVSVYQCFIALYSSITDAE